MAAAITYTTKLEKASTEGGWHYVRLTPEIREELRQLSGKNGNVPVVVTIGKTSWPSTTMSMGEQQWFIAVKADVRKIEAIAEGDSVTVSVTPDFERL